MLKLKKDNVGLPCAAVACLVILGLTACAGPKPILYPNDHYKSVGEARAQQEIAECRDMAEAAGASPEQSKGAQTAKRTAVGGGVGAAAGAVGGAIVGSPGTGAAIGAASGATAGFIRGLFSSNPPSKAYTEFVDRCLMDRGYEPVGWE